MAHVRRLPLAEPPSSLRKDGSRAFVQTADVKGRFATARRLGFVLLIVVYAALPWVRIAGRPAIFLDIEHREFFLFGQSFNAQDVWLLFFLLTGVGFALVVTTAVAGRVWCGWACPQTVFLDGVFRRIERWIEGPREARIRLHDAPWTFSKVWRKTLKHFLYALVSVALAHVFVSYFVSLPRLWAMMREAPGQHLEAFVWTAALSVVFYVDFAHFREQLCLAICPYGRLQSALTDKRSLTVGYDTQRGEPRGKATETGHGDCVDCNRCVVVCPTGIDIRRGMQLDCIGCTACIDACDEIMDKLHRPRGLIRYDTLEGLDHQPKKFWRPRLGVYAVLGVAGLVAASVAFASHRDFEANLLRLHGAPFTVDGDVVRDGFEIHLVNKRNVATTLVVTPVEAEGVTFLVPQREVALAPLEGQEIPVFVSMPVARFRRDFTVHLRVTSRDEPGHAPVELSAPFVGPSGDGGGAR